VQAAATEVKLLPTPRHLVDSSSVKTLLAHDNIMHSSDRFDCGGRHAAPWMRRSQ
jgi:hypothetical protein